MFRFSLPTRVPLSFAFVFATALFLLQQIGHTSVYFSACSFLFVVISAQAFNLAGGLSRASGGYVFFYSMNAVVLGLTVKAILGEPGGSNLVRPHLTITIYAVSSLMLLLAVAAARKFERRKPFLEKLVGDNNLSRATIGCLVIGILLTVATRTTTRGAGTAWSVLLQVNRFCELAIILGVTDSLRKSGGRRSINLPVILSGITLLIMNGLVGFSKEGFLTPPLCWLLAAAAQRIRLSLAEILLGAAAFAGLVYYMVPYSGLGRTQSAPGLVGNFPVAFRLLSNLPAVRRQFNAQLAFEASQNEGSAGYFNKPQGLFDRLQMISFDDLLNDATEREGPEGYYPLLVDFENLVPHFFWPNKPLILWGNVYAHEAGINIAEDDFSTGVSFSPTGEAYHLARWTGILVIAPLLWFALFLLFDSLCGDVQKSPWGLLVIIFFAHIAPEGLLAGIIYSVGYLTFAIVFAAITTGYVMPLLGGLFVGPGDRFGGRQRRLQPSVRLRPPVLPADGEPSLPR